jgi:hypothetical protein
MRVQIGWVMLDADGTPVRTGGYHTTAKLYRTEGIAKGARGNCMSVDKAEFEVVPAYIDGKDKTEPAGAVPEWFHYWWLGDVRHGMTKTEAFTSLVSAMAGAAVEERRAIAGLVNPLQPIETADKGGDEIPVIYAPGTSRSGDTMCIAYHGDWPSGEHGETEEHWIAVAGMPVRQPTLWCYAPLPPEKK